MIDIGAKVSVCGEQQAKLWGTYDEMKPSFAKVHPYNSSPIKVTGTPLCSISFKNRAVPVEFYQDNATQFKTEIKQTIQNYFLGQGWQSYFQPSIDDFKSRKRR